MEREFLVGVDFRLYVDKGTYETWLNLLTGLVIAKERECLRWQSRRRRALYVPSQGGKECKRVWLHRQPRVEIEGLRGLWRATSAVFVADTQSRRVPRVPELPIHIYGSPSRSARAIRLGCPASDGLLGRVRTCSATRLEAFRCGRVLSDVGYVLAMFRRRGRQVSLWTFPPPPPPPARDRL